MKQKFAGENTKESEALEESYRKHEKDLRLVCCSERSLKNYFQEKVIRERENFIKLVNECKNKDNLDKSFYYFLHEQGNASIHEKKNDEQWEILIASTQGETLVSELLKIARETKIKQKCSEKVLSKWEELLEEEKIYLNRFRSLEKSKQEKKLKKLTERQEDEYFKDYEKRYKEVNDLIEKLVSLEYEEKYENEELNKNIKEQVISQFGSIKPFYLCSIINQFTKASEKTKEEWGNMLSKQNQFCKNFAKEITNIVKEKKEDNITYEIELLRLDFRVEKIDLLNSLIKKTIEEKANNQVQELHALTKSFCSVI